MPSMARSMRSIPMSLQERGRILRAFAEEGEESGALSLDKGGAWAAVVPSGDRPECRVVAEAADMEAADELCALYEDKIRALLKGSGKK